MFTSKFEDDPSRNLLDTLNSLDAQLGEDSYSVHTDHSRNLLTEPSPRPMLPPTPHDPPDEAYLEEAMREEWSDEVTRFSKAIWNSLPFQVVPCSVRGITVEAHCNPIMEVNIMPWHLAVTLLGNVPLGPSDMLLESYPFGCVLECRGVASAVPLMIDEIEISLLSHLRYPHS